MKQLTDIQKADFDAKKRETRQTKRLSMLGHYNRELQRQIKDHLWENYSVSLPPLRQYYKDQVKEIFNYEAYDTELHTHLDELCKFYYSLGDNRVFLAQVSDSNGFIQDTKRLGQYYSKHRLDPIWNSSKSKKFRAIMAKFLTEEKWYERYQPTHLVLTVPHKFGKWKGKEIYVHELIKAFRALRDQRWWKKYIHGGLYCLEVKKNKENGYHIHLHVLCFQYPKIEGRPGMKDASGDEVPVYMDDDFKYKIKKPVNFVRTQIKKSWKSIVGNTTDYDGIHYSSLYFNERDEHGNLIYETVGQGFMMASDQDPGEYQDEFGNWVDPMEITKERVQKHYVKPGDDVQCWIKGVMECLKYHFKPGVLEKQDGSFDMHLIREILQETKGDRFMSKFGKLHNHPGLSLNGKTADDDIDSDCLGSAEEAGRALMNRETGEVATPDQFIILCTGPENMIATYDARGEPTIRLKARSPVLFFEQGTTVKEAFTQYCSGKFTKGIRGTTTDRIALEGRFSLWPKPREIEPRAKPQPVLAYTPHQPLTECPF